MRARTVITAAFLLTCAATYAQNLNPEVQVTNKYVSRMMEVNKQGLDMAIPDTLYEFDYHFDYSVFETPYRGAYEFRPYSIGISPRPEIRSNRDFYLRAGAGYSFHPELFAVWNPRVFDRMELNVVEDFNGFAGTYVNRGKGYDFANLSSADIRVGFDKFDMDILAGYEGIFTGLDSPVGFYNSGFASARFSSKPGSLSFLSYDLGAAYRYVNDHNYGTTAVYDHEILVDGTVGTTLDNGLGLFLDFNLAMCRYWTEGLLKPHVKFSLGSFHFDAGAGFSYCHNLSIYPKLDVSLDVFDGAGTLYAGFNGHESLNFYSCFKHMSHRFSPMYNLTPDVGYVPRDYSLGLRGRVFKTFCYDVRAGYRVMKNEPLWCVSETVSGVLNEYIRQTDYNQAYIEALLSWKNTFIDIDAEARFSYTGSQVPDFLIMPALFEGGMRARYNHNDRLFIGLGVQACSNRRTNIPELPHGKEVVIPWYLDLGLNAEYRLNSKISLWAKACNLLCMEIYRTPVYAEQGPYVTAGLTLGL